MNLNPVTNYCVYPMICVPMPNLCAKIQSYQPYSNPISFFHISSHQRSGELHRVRLKLSLNPAVNCCVHAIYCAIFSKPIFTKIYSNEFYAKPNHIVLKFSSTQFKALHVFETEWANHLGRLGSFEACGEGERGTLHPCITTQCG